MLIIIMAATTVAFFQIHTYITGQDPRTYIVLGRQLAEQHFSLQGIREVAKFVVPGYPLMLGATIALLGVKSAFFLNSVLFGLLMWLLYRLFARLTGNIHQAGFMMLLCMGGLFAGYHHNAHYLLLAFRNTPMYLFSVAALLCLVRAVQATGDKARFSWAACGSAVLFLLGVGIRETVVFLLPPMLLYLLVCTPKQIGWRSRCALWGSFLLPLAVPGAALLLLLLLKPGLILNSQSRHLLDMLPVILRQFSLSSPAFRQTLEFILDELHWTGLVFCVLGICFARKRPAFLCLFLVPAILYFFFDGAIKAHRRFFLTTLFFLLPLAALGATEVVRWAGRLVHRILPRLPAQAGRWSATALLILICCWTSRTVANLAVWGPHITAGKINALLALFEELQPAHGQILVDGRCRYLIDAMTVFTDFEPLNAAYEENLIVDPPYLFIEPLNARSFFALNFSPSAVDAVQLQGNIHRTGKRFEIGRGRFAATYVVPWSDSGITQSVARADAYPATLRLTAPQLWNDSYGRTSIRVMLDGREVAGHLEKGANFIVVSNPPAAANHELVIESDKAIPADFQPKWYGAGDDLSIPLGAYTVPSYAHFLSDEFFQFPSPDFNARELAEGGGITLPIPYAPSLYLTVMLRVATVHNEPDIPVTVTLADSDGIELADHSFRASSSARFVIMHIPPRSTATDLTRINLRFSHPPYRNWIPDQRGQHYMLQRLYLSPNVLGEPYSIDFGEFEDFVYALHGFWPQERTRTTSGRWTKESARIFLPLAPGRDYTLSVQHQLLRVEGAPPPDISFALNGERLPAENVTLHDDRLLVQLPGSAITSPSNTVDIISTPWRPKDYPGGRDRRSLGIFIHQIDILPSSTESSP